MPSRSHQSSRILHHIANSQNPRFVRRLLHAGWIFAILLGVVVAAGELVVFSRFTVDDALISLRYARNWSHGGGLVYNPGERIEGFSNPLLVLLTGAAFRVGIDGLLCAKVLGFTAYCAILLLLLLRIRSLSLTGPVNLVLLAVPFAITAPAFGLTFYAVSGLETVISGALILFVTLRAASRPHGLSPWLAMIPLAMVRPEAPAYALIPAAARFWSPLSDRLAREPLWRRYLGPALFLLALLIGFVARLVYYGESVPNTFYAKVPWDFYAWIPSQAQGLFNLIMWPVRGFDDIVDFATATGLALLVIMLALLTDRGRLTLEAKLALLAIGIGLSFQKYAGGDWMIGARFMVPLIPLAGLLWIEVLAPRCRQIAEVTKLSLAGVIVIVLLVLTHANAALSFMQVTDWRYAQMTSKTTLQPLGEWVGAHVPKDWLMYSSAIGAVGYYGQCRIIDSQGLVSRDIAKLRAAGAHESVGEYVQALRPDVIMDESLVSDERIERSYGKFVRMFEVRTAGYAAQIYIREDRVPHLIAMPQP